MNDQIKELQGCFCPYWYLDLKVAVGHWAEVGLSPSDIFEIIEEQRDCLGYTERGGFEAMDPVYCVLDHILQMARNELDDVLGYDFQNDYRGSGTEIYTYGNFMCSSFDRSEGARAELQEKLDDATEGKRRALSGNRFVTYFLSQIDLELKEPF